MKFVIVNFIHCSLTLFRDKKCWDLDVSVCCAVFRLDTPIFENKVRFVCISDTHEKMEELLPVIPDGDVLIHAGDFTNYGDIGEVIKFNAQIGIHLQFTSNYHIIKLRLNEF